MNQTFFNLRYLYDTLIECEIKYIMDVICYPYELNKQILIRTYEMSIKDKFKSTMNKIGQMIHLDKTSEYYTYGKFNNNHLREFFPPLTLEEITMHEIMYGHTVDPKKYDQLFITDQTYDNFVDWMRHLIIGLKDLFGCPIHPYSLTKLQTERIFSSVIKSPESYIITKYLETYFGTIIYFHHKTELQESFTMKIINPLLIKHIETNINVVNNTATRIFYTKQVIIARCVDDILKYKSRLVQVQSVHNGIPLIDIIKNRLLTVDSQFRREMRSAIDNLIRVLLTVLVEKQIILVNMDLSNFYYSYVNGSVYIIDSNYRMLTSAENENIQITNKIKYHLIGNSDRLFADITEDSARKLVLDMQSTLNKKFHCKEAYTGHFPPGYSELLDKYNVYDDRNNSDKIQPVIKSDYHSKAYFEILFYMKLLGIKPEPYEIYLSIADLKIC